jgi:hypothetical protein
VMCERADFSWTNLSLVDLTASALPNADLRHANLLGANLMWANLACANLAGAHLSGATLRGTGLHGACLVGTNLRSAMFIEGSLAHADLTGSTVSNAVFVGLDLRTTKGIDALNHEGPSNIDLKTIFNSEGELPEVFLRGIGVPNAFITYAKSLATSPIKFYSCFISHSTQDREFAERLHADLQDKGVRCWFAPRDIRGGRRLYEQIDEAIRFYDRLLLILSEPSMNSDWVRTEIINARTKELRDKGQALFPVRIVDFEKVSQWRCFDADIGRDLARDIREYFIPDFTRWREYDFYQPAFARLLSDLKNAEEQAHGQGA